MKRNGLTLRGKDAVLVGWRVCPLGQHLIGSEGRGMMGIPRMMV